MVGKDPHRPEGKTKDAERMSAVAYARDAPYVAPSASEIAQRDREQMQRRGGPTRFPAEELIRGARPRVGSRVKDAIERREAREERE